MNGKPWPTEDDDIVRQYYPIGGVHAVLEHLPHRSKATIWQRARKLGVPSQRDAHRESVHPDLVHKLWAGFVGVRP